MSGSIYDPGEGIRTIDLMGTTVTSKVDGAGTGDAFVIAETQLHRVGSSLHCISIGR